MVISLRIYRFHRSLSCFIVVLTAIAVLVVMATVMDPTLVSVTVNDMRVRLKGTEGQFVCF